MKTRVKAVAAAVAAVLTASSAWAQESADAAATDRAATESGAQSLQEVTITGSRIVRPDYEANSPITSVTAATLESTGATTLENALNQLPQFAIGANQTNAGFGGSGTATLNLRALGSFRNLVLLDGRRLQPSDILQSIDINTIPSALIENVEVITGGASAVYGSDAISGVVNIKLKDRFEGVQIDTQYNVFEENWDGQTFDTALTVGGNFADNRGNAVVSLSYTDRKDIGYMDREFFRQSPGGTDFRLPTGIYRPSVNPPSQAAVDAVFAQYGAAAGRVPRTSVLGYNDDGTLFSANNRSLNYRGPDGLLYNTGTQLNNLNQFSRIQVPLERYSALAKGSYDITDNVTGYAQLIFTTYDSLVNAEAGNDAFNVPVTNPWISDDLATILASRQNPTAPFRWEKRFQEEAGPRNFSRTFDVFQYVGGAKGKIESIDGTWDVYGSHGRTKLTETNQGSVLIGSLNQLLNAPDGGLSLCQGGYNPFGLTQLSADCRDFLVASPISVTELEQNVVEASVQGRLFALPAGDVRFASGVGYRENSYAYAPDRDLARGNIVGVFRTGPSDGKSQVVEGYAEFLLPLLRDLPFVRKFDVDVAYRYSDYKLSGGVDTYKADFNWEIASPVRVRGGYQHAVRAPSVGELFAAPNVSIPGIGNLAGGQGDPCHFQSQARTGADAAAVRALCLAQGVPVGLIDTYDNLQNEVLATNSGNTDLLPESADTYTLGVVWTSQSDSELFSKLSASLDYYKIEIEDVIGTIGAPQTIPKCFNRDGSNPGLAADNFYCSQINRDPVTGLFTNVRQPTLNLGGYRTKGADLQVDWGVGLGAIGLDDRYGALTLNTVVSYLESFEVQLQKNAAWFDYAGAVGTPSASQPGSLPRWKGVTRLQYDIGAIGAGVKWRYIDEMKNSARVTNTASTVPGTPSYSYFDLFGSWEVNDTLAVNGGINNLADKGPPIVGTTPGSTQSSTYDIYGRQYYVAISLKF